MKKIGILYLCTGPYVAFWKDFFDSFDKLFCPNAEKHYYVFTDAENIYMERECDRIEIFHLSSQPWPLVTLLRFHTFLSIEDRLKENDYIMFFNANLKCMELVSEDEILPKGDKELFFVQHPGYMNVPKSKYPYERNKKSLAYIPYNCGQTYVIGAMFGGITEAFLRMSRIMKDRIDSDLKNNVIALWHDESQINRYIVDKDNYVLLSPAYCYPWGFEISYEKKIVSVSKQDKFDVRLFKHNIQEKDTMYKRRIRKGINLLCRNCKERWMYHRDSILNRKVKVL